MTASTRIVLGRVVQQPAGFRQTYSRNGLSLADRAHHHVCCLREAKPSHPRGQGGSLACFLGFTPRDPVHQRDHCLPDAFVVSSPVPAGHARVQRGQSVVRSWVRTLYQDLPSALIIFSKMCRAGPMGVSNTVSVPFLLPRIRPKDAPSSWTTPRLFQTLVLP